MLLPPSAASERIEQLRIAQDAASEISRLEGLAADLEARRSKLVVPESLVRHDEVPLDLANRLGSHRKAAEDLPRIHAEVEELESQARTVLRETGRTARLDEAEAWRIDAVTQAAIRKLAIDRSALMRRAHETQKMLVERRARRAALLARRETTTPAPDVGALKKAVARAERDGSLEERLAKTTAQARRIQQRARAELSALGLGHLELEAASGLAVPPSDKVERCVREWAELERDEEHLATQSLDLEGHLAKLNREIQALELAGKVPTERDLLAARERRNEAWKRVRKALAGSLKEKDRAKSRDRRDLASQFEGPELRGADEISDRLRREAERVGRLAALLAERDVATARKGTTVEERSELSIRQEAKAGDWRRLWQRTGVEPGVPSEMKSWLLGHAALLRTAEELRAILADEATVRASIDAHRQRLCACSRCMEPLSKNRRLLPPCSTAPRSSSNPASEERSSAAKSIATSREIGAQLTVLVAEEGEHAKARKKLDDAWKRAVAPLGTSEQASPDEVTLTIDLLAEMFHKIDQADAARRRATGIERDADLFARDVESVAREHAPDLMGRAADTAAAEIIERYHRGRADVAERREIERQLAEANRMLAAQRERRRAADALVAALMRDAAVDTVEGLATAEQRSDEARELDRHVAALEGELLELGIGSLGLPAEMAELDPDTASARLEDVDAELEQLRQRASMIDQRIGGVEKGQKALENPQAGRRMPRSRPKRRSPGCATSPNVMSGSKLRRWCSRAKSNATGARIRVRF